MLDDRWIGCQDISRFVAVRWLPFSFLKRMFRTVFVGREWIILREIVGVGFCLHICSSFSFAGKNCSLKKMMGSYACVCWYTNCTGCEYLCRCSYQRPFWSAMYVLLRFCTTMGLDNYVYPLRCAKFENWLSSLRLMGGLQASNLCVGRDDAQTLVWDILFCQNGSFLCDGHG